MPFNVVELTSSSISSIILAILVLQHGVSLNPLVNPTLAISNTFQTSHLLALALLYNLKGTGPC